MQWLLSLRSGALGHAGFTVCGPRAQLPCGMWNPPGHLATREVPVFQNVPEVPHEAVTKTVLIRQNREYFCLLQIKTQGPGSGSSQKRPWLRGTLLREPWRGWTGPSLLLPAASAAPFLCGSAPAPLVLQRGFPGSVSSRRCCGASSGAGASVTAVGADRGVCCAAAVMEGCACTCHRRGPGRGPRQLGLRALLQRVRRGGAEVGAQLPDSPALLPAAPHACPPAVLRGLTLGWLVLHFEMVCP